MSIFRPKKTRIPVSYFMLESMQEFVGKFPDCTIAQAIAGAIIAYGMKPTDFTQDDIEAIALRIHQLQEQEQQLAEGMAQELTEKGTGVGTDFLNSISAMQMDQKCLFATGSDYARARHLFCDLDKEECDYIVTAAIEMKWKELKTIFESVIVGMGGELSSDNDAVDLSTPEGLAELKAFGF